MAATVWVYSDWVTLDRGNPDRLARLRLHIQEVSNKLAEIKSYSVGSNFSVQRSTAEIPGYLKQLQDSEKEETRILAATSGKAVGWSHARTRR